MLSNHLVLCHHSFPLSEVFTSGGQSIGASALVSVLPMNIQGWFPLKLTGWISLQSKGLSRVSSTTVRKHQFFSAHPSLWSNSHIRPWLLGKPQPWLDRSLSAKWYRDVFKLTAGTLTAAGTTCCELTEERTVSPCGLGWGAGRVRWGWSPHPGWRHRSLMRLLWQVKPVFACCTETARLDLAGLTS